MQTPNLSLNSDPACIAFRSFWSPASSAPLIASVQAGLVSLFVRPSQRGLAS